MGIGMGMGGREGLADIMEGEEEETSDSDKDSRGDGGHTFAVPDVLSQHERAQAVRSKPSRGSVFVRSALSPPSSPSASAKELESGTGSVEAFARAKPSRGSVFVQAEAGNSWGQQLSQQPQPLHLAPSLIRNPLLRFRGSPQIRHDT